MELRTRVFDLARAEGITDAELARRMNVATSGVCRVKSGERGIQQIFIRGALQAFPELTFEELFFWDPERAVLTIEQAKAEHDLAEVYG